MKRTWLINDNNAVRTLLADARERAEIMLARATAELEEARHSE